MSCWLSVACSTFGPLSLEHWPTDIDLYDSVKMVHANVVDGWRKTPQSHPHVCLSSAFQRRYSPVHNQQQLL